MKKLLAVIALLFTFSMLVPSYSSANVGINEKFGLPIVVYGGNLSADEKASVAESLDVAEEVDVE